MSRFISKTSKIFIGIGVIGGAAGAGVGLFYAFLPKHHKSFISPQPFHSGKFFNVNLKTYKTSSNGQYYLNEDELNTLKGMMMESLDFGPEIHGLKAIHIGDENVHVEDASGFYTPSTQEIYINVHALAQGVPFDAPSEAKVSNVFDIIFHEYNHHLSYSYMANNMSADPVADQTLFDIVDGTNQKKHNYWNKHFVSEFKHELKYDVDTPKYKWRSVEIAHQDGKKELWASIPGYYNAKELFDIANSDSMKSINVPSSKMFIGGKDSSFIPQKSMDPNDIFYLYSMDELFARKYQMIDQAYGVYKGGIWKDPDAPHPQPVDGWLDSGSPAPWLFDILRFQNGLYNFRKQPDNEFRYLHDAPYQIDGGLYAEDGIGAKAMNASLIKYVGQASGSDITWMIHRTASRSPWASDAPEKIYDDNQIKFGGYLKDTENYKYIGFVDASNNFVKYPIEISESKWRYKSNVGNFYDGTANVYAKSQMGAEKKFYVTSDWVSGSQIQGHKLYFANQEDGSDKVALKSVRSGNEGRTISYVNDDSKHTNQKVFEAYVDDSGDVKLRSVPCT